MKIRSITAFACAESLAEAVQGSATFLKDARARFVDAGFEVQTVRLALGSFADRVEASHAVEFARELEARCQDAGIDYATVGATRLEHAAAYTETIVDILAATSTIFAAAEIAHPRRGIDTAAVTRAARVIEKAAPIEPNGFGNLRFTALANVEPGVPFLPAAYHDGGSPAFAVAVEAADLAVDAFTASHDVNEARTALVDSIERHAKQLADVAASVAGDRRFGGIDFSLAPFPTNAQSLGGALELLAPASLGASGSVAAAAVLTACIDTARFPRAGFSGLFLPVLEDTVLAQRAAEGSLGLNELLLYSCVCGTGLDTVPLPGDISELELAAILTDVAAIALRLHKPLTARLMPMPGCAAGDALSFDFPYFADGAVMDHAAAPLADRWQRTAVVPLPSRLRSNANDEIGG